MTFTKREQRRGESVAGAMWVLIVFMVVGLLLFASGCTSQATTVEERAEEVTGYVETMRAAGLKGRAVMIWGTGHAGGQAFNISGSSGFVEVSFGDDE